MMKVLRYDDTYIYIYIHNSLYIYIYIYNDTTCDIYIYIYNDALWQINIDPESHHFPVETHLPSSARVCVDLLEGILYIMKIIINNIDVLHDIR